MLFSFEDYIQINTKPSFGCLPPKIPMMEKQGPVRGKLIYSRASSLKRQWTEVAETIKTSQCQQGLL